MTVRTTSPADSSSPEDQAETEGPSPEDQPTVLPSPEERREEDQLAAHFARTLGLPEDPEPFITVATAHAPAFLTLPAPAPQFPVMAAQPAAQAAAPPVQAQSGSLRGTTPEIFRGSRDKADTFKREFDLYRGLNIDHDIMTTPYKRAILFLSLIKGAAVDDWVADQVAELWDKTTRQQNRIGQDEEVLWTDLVTAFNSNFADTTREQRAHHQIQHVKMESGGFDEYVSRFRQLAKRAGYDLNAQGTLDRFSQGLTRGLLGAILMRDQFPTTFTQWIAAAQDEIRKHQRRMAMLYPNKQAYFPSRRTHTNGRHGTPRRHPNDETVPMDVDRAYTEEDKNRYRADGRCFYCEQQGHMARDCPMKKKQASKPGKPFQKRPTGKQSFQKKPSNRDTKQAYRKRNQFPSRTFEARGASIEEVEEDNEQEDDQDQNGEEDISDLAVRTQRLPEEDKIKFLAEMKELDMDF